MKGDKPDRGDPLSLSDEERESFERRGFLVIDRPVVAPHDLAEVRELVQGLFDRFDGLPRDSAYDLGDVKHHPGPQQLPEINRTMALEPRLAGTVAFARCKDLAREVLGGRATCVFDHAICKPPNNGAEIEWHQDLAYAPETEHLPQVHMWLALQDVTEANGCLRFIPNDGRHGLLPHHRRGGSTHSHSLVAEGFDSSDAVACPVAAGMVTIHRLTTLHSSGPNTTGAPRFAWILQFRDTGPVRRRTRIAAALSAVKRSVLR